MRRFELAKPFGLPVFRTGGFGRSPNLPKSGRHCRIRTYDPLVPGQVRCQTALNADGSAGRLRSCDLRVMGPADFQTFPQRKVNRTERNRDCQPPDGVLIPQNSQEAHNGLASCRRPAKCARSILARSGPFQSSSRVFSFRFPSNPSPFTSRRLQL